MTPDLVVRAGVLGQKEWDDLQVLLDSGDLKAWGLRARDLCRTNIELWGMIVHDYSPMPHLAEYYQATKKFRNRLVAAGRGSGKSNGIIIRGQTHEMAYGTIAQTEFEVPKTLLIQENDDLAAATMKACATTVETGGPNGALHLMFPEITQRIEMGKLVWWLKTKWASKEPHFQGVGIGSAITGMHPRRVIMDDPATLKNSRTAAARELHWQWYSKTVRPMLMDNAQIDIIHTPYYKGDLPDIVGGLGNFWKMRLPSLNRKPEKEDYELDEVEVEAIVPGEDGKPTTEKRKIITGVRILPRGMDLRALWPCPNGTGKCPRTKAHYLEVGYHVPVEYLIEEYHQDPNGFLSQHLLRLVDEQNTRIKRHMLRYWSSSPSKIGTMDESGNEIVAFPPAEQVVVSVHGWDHAIGKKAQNDRTAGSMMYRTKDNKVFVRNRYGRWDFPEAIRTMEGLAETDPVRKPAKIVSEGKGFQEAYEQMLVKTSKNIPPVESIKHNMDKDTALVESGLLSAMLRGDVYIELEDADTKNELLSFTPAQNGEEHDDIVDAMRIAYAAIRAAVHKRATILRDPRQI